MPRPRAARHPARARLPPPRRDPPVRPPAPPLLVVVSGPPGAGKTTIARALADGLGLPLVEKDTLKEALGGALGITERSESQRLGAAVLEAMTVIVRELLERGVSVVAEANFTAAWSLLRALPPCRVCQVHVTATPDVLTTRLRDRDTHRHPVHYDREAADEIADRAERGEWDALPLDGALVEVDTSEAFPDVAALVQRVASVA